VKKAAPVTATLRITCADQRGLVAAVADFVSRNGGNIIDADQHADAAEKVFLQRVEWELDGFGIPRGEIAGAFAGVASDFGMTWKLSFSDEVPRVAIFVTKQAHCLHDLLARWQSKEFAADIPLVVSNHDKLRQVAERFDVEFCHFPIRDDDKREQEDRILTRLENERIDLVVLARYMQILTAEFVRRYPDRIINIHHSFLPAFPGARPYHHAHARGVKIIGATAHYVTAGLDEGPIIEQDVVRVSHRDSVADLIRKGRDLEKVVLARAVAQHLSGRVLVYGNKTVVFA